ncbi:hypothetical protein GGD38_003532 [Chitinophagaceae bacterium OAS944]|nr:hypothetical protein [Chitinophagaceae bacterium OAS944]
MAHRDKRKCQFAMGNKQGSPVFKNRETILPIAYCLLPIGFTSLANNRNCYLLIVIKFFNGTLYTNQ